MKILVIEDQREHQQQAKQVLEAAGHEVTIVSDMDTAQESMTSMLYPKEGHPAAFDGVITDMYFPYRRFGRGSGGMDFSNPETPCGMAIAAMCDHFKIPFVICTAGYHHGNRYQWAYAAANQMRWLFIDGYPKSDPYVLDAPEKNWEGALKALIEKVSGGGEEDDDDE